MSKEMIAALVGGEQAASAAQRNRDSDLRSLPKQWRRALLCIDGRKRPICPYSGHELKGWRTGAAPSYEHLLCSPAVGLRTGPISGTLCLDFDGPEAWKTFTEIFDGSAEKLLPRTVSWTSGKEGRQQMAFNIEPEQWPLLRSTKTKVGTLEIRWDGLQSVVMGAHPETAGYQWVNSPATSPLATFPAELLRKVPQNKSVRSAETKREGLFNGFSVPLIQFVSYKTRWLVENGSIEGNCNHDSLRVSMDLCGAEIWLKEQGVGVDLTADSLYEEYLDRCPRRIHGAVFDYQAAWRRFEGARARNPFPATPEDKLLDRLRFHRRQANKHGGVK